MEKPIIKADIRNNKESAWQAQKPFVRRVDEMLGDTPRKAFVRTYGCQQNVSDSERLRGMLAEMGYTFTDGPEDADLVIFNTCAVRDHAEKRVLGNVGALKGVKEKRPAMRIAVCGCMMQEPETAKTLRRHYPYVDLVFGTGALPRFPELLYRLLAGERHVVDTEEPEDVAEGLPVRREGRYTAWLPVMQGCNNFCTYCIVPYVRGREHSRAPENVLAEAADLVKNGYKDITLLGQNVNSYGRGLPDGWDFSRLLAAVSALPGDFRLRFMTSHPKDASPRLFETMAENPKAARHLHLPFQSGSDRVLERMNRRYTAESYRELVRLARETIPDLCLTADVIVGFPGETEADFRQTLELVKEIRFANLYMFRYSPRAGTPAAEMPDPVPEKEKAAWFDELLKTQAAVGRAYLESRVGKTERVLALEVKDGVAFGRADSGIAVSFAAEEPGRFYPVNITRVKGVTLYGEAERKA